MKKYKVSDKLKRIWFSIVCIIMLIFTMPVKVKAVQVDDFLDLLLCIPDAIEFCLNRWISDESFDETTEEINIKGWDTKGKLPDFLVTPYEIFCSGTMDENGRVRLPLLDANFFKEKETKTISLPDGAKGEGKEVEITLSDANNSADILRPVVSNTYNSLSVLVIVLMMLVLLYIGIRIIVATVSTDQVKYKQMLMDWLVAMCLLFCMHYIMSFIMSFNEMIIEILADKSAASDEYYIGLNKVESLSSDKHLNYNDPVSIVESDGVKSFSKRHLIYPANEVNEQNRFSIDSKNGKFATGYYITGYSKQEYNYINSSGTGTVDLDVPTFSEISGGYLSASISRRGKNDEVVTIYKGNLVEYMRAITSFDHQDVTFYSKDGTRSIGNSGSTAQNFGYGVLYIIIVIETVVFVIKYIGRVINLAFLTAIAPLIAFMYPIDRIGDSKAQTFNTWFKDYLYRALLQPLDLLLYTIFIYGAYTLMDKSVIYAIGMYAFMLVAEKYFKKLFGFDKTAAGGGGLGSPLAGALTMRGLDKLSGTGPGSKRGAGGGGASGESSKPKIKIPKRKFEKSGAENNSSEKTSLMPNSNGAVKRKGTAVPKSGGNTSKNGNSRMPLLGSIGKTAGRRLSKAVTGGKYDHLKGTKGGFFKAAAGNAAKSVGRTGIRTAGKIGGAVLGAGAGLLAGSIATAVTGDVSNLSKGIEAGGFTGWNRGGQIADYGMGRAGDFVDEVNAWRATKDPDYRDKVLRDNSLKTWQDDLSQCSSEDRAKYEETIKDFSPYIRDFDSFDQIKAMSKMRDEYKDSDGNIDMDKMEDVLNTTKDVGRFNLDKKEDRENLKSKLLEDAKEKGLEGPELYASVKKDFERRIKYHKALND